MSTSTKPRRNDLPAGSPSTPTLIPNTTRERARAHNVRPSVRAGALAVVRLCNDIARVADTTGLNRDARDILAGLRVLADAFRDSVRHRQGWGRTR